MRHNPQNSVCFLVCHQSETRAVYTMPSTMKFLRVTLALAACALLHAQFDTGSITGLIKDASGSAVPDAKVTLIDDSTGVNLATRSNDAGVYEFPNVRVGRYKIKTEKSGFALAA